MTGFVPIIMGSKSDLEQGRKVAAALAELGIASEIRVGSAHKSPAHLLEILAAYEDDAGPKVYVTIAGRSNALSGFVDAQVSAPVIACPPLSSTFAGADIYSSLRMPGGVAPAVVLEPAGAALLAAKILGLGDQVLRERVVARQQGNVDRIVNDDRAIGNER